MEAEARGSQVCGQPVNLVRPCLKIENKKSCYHSLGSILFTNDSSKMYQQCRVVLESLLHAHVFSDFNFFLLYFHPENQRKQLNS